ncbi:MAG: hypothetical protein K2I93_04625 [Oscillospiraceae bacterium]|nr:hypothetical protein [Oscillospiraceae bacterium]
MTKKTKLLLSAGVLLLIGILLLVVYLFRNTDSTEPTAVKNNPDSTETTYLSISTEAVAETETTYPVPSYEAVPLEVETIEPEETELRIEAEECDFTGLLEVETLRSGYSGEGYLAGFSQTAGDGVQAVFDVPVTQHYDVTISVAADEPVTNALLLNGERLGEFTINENDQFIRVTFSGIYLEAGEAQLAIEEIDGFFSIDYFELSNYTEMYEIDYRDSYPLSDPKASAGAKKLMKLLAENYGEKLITGQHCSGDADSEMDLIYHLTGKYPAIRFGDVEGYSSNTTTDGGDVIGACERWAERGGIVGLMWHWDAPAGVSSVYAADTEFSLLSALPPYTVVNELVEQTTETTEAATDETEAAVTTEAPTEPEYVQRFQFSVDVALMEMKEIEKLVQDGVLSENCAAILRDIDAVSETLKPLAEQDIPILWRPLHEASGDWFWWGADGAEPYRWLWDTMYRRMTEYHGLHNLIWVWNGQNAAYLVDNYDIASLDIYLKPEKPFESRYEQFVSLSRMTGGEKMLALSECSTVLNLNRMYRDNTIWSYFGLWYGDYIVDEDGNYSETYTKADDMIALYNSEAVLTLNDIAE